MIAYHHVLMIVIAIAIITFCKASKQRPCHYGCMTNSHAAVLLAGCTSDGMSGVYLISLQYNAPSTPIPTLPGEVNPIISHAIRNVSQAGNGSTFAIRAGYRGICMGQDDLSRICSSSAEKLARMARAEKKTIGHGNTSMEVILDPLNLIMIAEDFKQKVVFDGFMQV